MAYSEKVIEHYENPRNVGTLDKNDPNVGTGLVGAPACGDVMKLQIKVNDDGHHRGRQVQDLRLRLGHRVVVARHRVGQGHDPRPGDGIKNTQIVEELNLPPVKIHCSVLAEDAIKSAIADYKANDGARVQVGEPERQGHVRMRRERPVLGPPPRGACHVICWSCERRRAGGAVLRRVRRAPCRRTTRPTTSPC